MRVAVVVVVVISVYQYMHVVLRYSVVPHAPRNLFSLAKYAMFNTKYCVLEH